MELTRYTKAIVTAVSYAVAVTVVIVRKEPPEAIETQVDVLNAALLAAIGGVSTFLVYLFPNKQ